MDNQYGSPFGDEMEHAQDNGYWRSETHAGYEDPEAAWEDQFGMLSHESVFESPLDQAYSPNVSGLNFEAGGGGDYESFAPQESEMMLDQESYFDSETGTEEEVVVANNRLRSIRARAAQPPCNAPSPVTPPTGTSGGSPSRGSGQRAGTPRVPDYRPGSGRVRRRYSRPYVMWVQRALNQVLGTALAVDGVWGRRTSAALRTFQRREGLQVDGKIGPQSEGALRRYVRTDPPERETEFERLEPGTVIAAAGLALNFVKFGFDTIAKITAGDVEFHGPRQAIGIRASNVPNTFLLRSIRRSALLTNFIEKSPIGIEQVNVKLRCDVQYDGLNLDARFSFDPQGRRSRLGRDTVIRIGDPMGLETKQAPVEWQRCGVADYRVLRIPISFRIDRPWPLDNYNENFELVLSTMYGFGATASGSQHAHIQNARVAWN